MAYKNKKQREKANKISKAAHKRVKTQKKKAREKEAFDKWLEKAKENLRTGRIQSL